MRVKLSPKNRIRFFSSILETTGSWKRVAVFLNVSPRTVRDWRAGKFFMQLKSFEASLHLTRQNRQSFSPQMFLDFWNTPKAGHQGGLARMKSYGNPGTPEGRSRGGRISILAHRARGDDFVAPKKIKKPKTSKMLAEFLGILIGDGHLSDYQLSVTTSSETDMAHAQFVQNLIAKLFGISATVKKKRTCNAVDVVASSRALVLYMHELGMQIGNKLEHGLSIPRWVMEKSVYQKAFLRGLFDTDGSIYLDKHTIRSKSYENLGWTITSYSDRLLMDIFGILANMGFSPSHRARQKSVYLRKHENIVRYFREIGSHNPKHLRRYREFAGRVPKWS